MKHPGFAAVAILTLALGIGVNTSIFTLLYSVALRPLPVKDPAEIVNVYQTFEGGASREVAGNIVLLSYPEYLNYRDKSHAFSGLTAYAEVTLSGDEGEKLRGLLVSDNYFSVLGGATSSGRVFSAGETQTLGQSPLAVISHSFWQRRFGADPTLIGKTLSLNHQRFTVVGIAAKEFRGTEMTVPDVWIPVSMQAEVMPGRDYLRRSDCSWLNVVGRLKKGVSEEQAQADLGVIANQTDQEHPGQKTRVSVVSGAYLNFPEARSRGIPLVTIVILAVGLVLLLACANVSNLLLARAATRKKEIAVRLALGASRLHLISQLLTESLLLALAGGAAGLLLAFWLPPLLFSFVPESGLQINLTPDLSVLGYAFLVSLITGVIFGLAPAIEATNLDLTYALKSEIAARGGRFGRSRLRSLLVITQVAVSFVLLIGAGLLVRSLQRAQSADPGFDPRNILVVSWDPTSAGYDAQKATTLYQQLNERLTALPGVRSVSLARVAPFAGKLFTGIETEQRDKGRELSVNLNVITPQYFRVLGIPIIRGRQFNEEDARGSQRVAVVSKAMANRFWSSEDPLGKRFKSGSSSYEVIGVAQDISSIDIAQPDGPFFYEAARPDDLPGMIFILRTDANTQGLVGPIEDVVHSLDRNLAVSVKQLEERLNERLQPARAGAMFSGTLSLLALLLATIGIYGLVAYFVSERTHEIGIRLALGAQKNDVLKLVLKKGMALTLIGLMIGLVCSFALTRLMTSVLFGVTTTDPLIFVTVPLCLVTVAFMACYIPARRATKVDPLVALRYE